MRTGQGLWLNSAAMTSACGNRTLHPYTIPLRAPLTTPRRSWFAGLGWESAQRSSPRARATLRNQTHSIINFWRALAMLNKSLRYRLQVQRAANKRWREREEVVPKVILTCLPCPGRTEPVLKSAHVGWPRGRIARHHRPRPPVNQPYIPWLRRGISISAIKLALHYKVQVTRVTSASSLCGAPRALRRRAQCPLLVTQPVAFGEGTLRARASQRTAGAA